MWTYETQTAWEQCRMKKKVMKGSSARQLQVLSEMSSWCLQELGTKANRKKPAFIGDLMLVMMSARMEQLLYL